MAPINCCPWSGKLEFQWQGQIDNTFVSLGSEHIALNPQLFVLREEQGKSLIVIRTIDDILLAGTDASMFQLIPNINCRSNPSNVVKGPATLEFYDMNIIPDENCSVAINID